MWTFTDKLRFNKSPMGCTTVEMSNLYTKKVIEDERWGPSFRTFPKTPEEICVAVHKHYNRSGDQVVMFTDKPNTTHTKNAAAGLLTFIRTKRLGTVKQTVIPGGIYGNYNNISVYLWAIAPDKLQNWYEKNKENKSVNKTSKRAGK